MRSGVGVEGQRPKGVWPVGGWLCMVLCVWFDYVCTGGLEPFCTLLYVGVQQDQSRC